MEECGATHHAVNFVVKMNGLPLRSYATREGAQHFIARFFDALQLASPEDVRETHQKCASCDRYDSNPNGSGSKMMYTRFCGLHGHIVDPLNDYCSEHTDFNKQPTEGEG